MRSAPRVDVRAAVPDEAGERDAPVLGKLDRERRGCPDRDHNRAAGNRGLLHELE